MRNFFKTMIFSLAAVKHRLARAEGAAAAGRNPAIWICGLPGGARAARELWAGMQRDERRW